MLRRAKASLVQREVGPKDPEGLLTIFTQYGEFIKNAPTTPQDAPHPAEGELLRRGKRNHLGASLTQGSRKMAPAA